LCREWRKTVYLRQKATTIFACSLIHVFSIVVLFQQLCLEANLLCTIGFIHNKTMMKSVGTSMMMMIKEEEKSEDEYREKSNKSYIIG
jgi:hypothetical protein